MTGPDLTIINWLLAASPVVFLVVVLMWLNWKTPRAGAVACALALVLALFVVWRGPGARGHSQRQGLEPVPLRADNCLDVRLPLQCAGQAERHNRHWAEHGRAHRRRACSGVGHRLGLLQLHPGSHRVRRARGHHRTAAHNARLLAGPGRRNVPCGPRLGRDLSARWRPPTTPSSW